MTKRKVTHYNVTEASASRALFPRVRGELPTIQVQFITTEGEVIEFEMLLHHAAQFIEQLHSSYYAAVPKLKIGRGLGSM